MPQRFNEQLAAYLRRVGIAASTLAEQSDVSQSTMSRIALGQRPPDLEKIARWAELLDLDPAETDGFHLAAQLAHCPPQIVELIARERGERDALLKRVERLEVAVRVLKGEDPEGRAAPAARRSPPRAR